MLQHELVTDLPQTPEEVAEAVTLESHSLHTFVKAAVHLTEESRFDSSHDIGILPDSIQTQAYMNGIMGHLSEAKRLQGITLRAALGKLMLRQRVAQNFIITPDSLDIPYDTATGNPLVSNEVLRDQLAYLVTLVDCSTHVQVQLATPSLFVEHGLADQSVGIIRPTKVTMPMGVTQTRYRLSITDRISTVDNIEALRGLTNDATPPDESLRFIKARLAEM